MEINVNGKIAVVTGGTSGIGFSIAQAFVTNGAQVVLTGINQAEVNQAVAAIGAGCTGFKADVRHLADMEALYQEVLARHGRLDAVVANAGVGDHGPLGTITEEQFDRTYDTNVKGVLFTVQPALPLMQGGGTVVVIGSTGSVQARRGMSLYCGAKAAVRACVKSWIQDIKGTGIRINVVSPGAVDTESLRKALGQALGADKVAAEVQVMGQGNPTGRIAEVHEVSQAVLFLSSDTSSFITGVELFVDGGLTAV